jgi:hypothetical protein
LLSSQKDNKTVKVSFIFYFLETTKKCLGISITFIGELTLLQPRTIFLVRFFMIIMMIFNTGCLIKNGPRFAIDNPNEKNFTGNEMALKTLQT